MDKLTWCIPGSKGVFRSPEGEFEIQGYVLGSQGCICDTSGNVWESQGCIWAKNIWRVWFQGKLGNVLSCLTVHH